MYLNPASVTCESTGGSYTINVSLENIDPSHFSNWIISPSDTWITITQYCNDNGDIIDGGYARPVQNIILYVNISSNSGGSRNGYISIDVNSPKSGSESGMIKISQDAGPSASISVNTTSTSVAGAGGTVSLTYTTSGSGTLDVKSNQSWATVSGSGNTRTITVAKNPSTSSSRSCTITGSFGGKTATTTITQSASIFKEIILSPTSKTMSYAGGTFTVTATCGNDVTGTNYWSVSSNVTWITITQTNNSHHDYSASISVSANSSSSRTGTISFTHGSGATSSLTVTQKGVSRTTMTGDNKLATRADFNSQMRSGYYSSDTSKVITGYEIKGLSWSDSSYDYVIELNNSGNYTSTNGRCVICSDIVRVNKGK